MCCCCCDAVGQVTMAVALLALLAASAAAATTTPGRRLLQADPTTATADPALKTFQPSQCNKVSKGIVVCPVGRTYSCCDSVECNSVRDVKKAAKEAGVGLSARQLCSLSAQFTDDKVYYACCKA